MEFRELDSPKFIFNTFQHSLKTFMNSICLSVRMCSNSLKYGQIALKFLYVILIYNIMLEKFVVKSVENAVFGNIF